ncbi:MAG: hypothetical protein PHC52_06270 [Syntrophales bacterium]|jgi:hypothetical protein|nr:hypothetical protein [Syntrophales bacterium]
MASEPNGRYPTWKWLAGILVVLLIAVGGYTLGGSFSEVKADIKTLQEKKVDKEAYYREFGQLCDTIKTMDAKLDRLLISKRLNGGGR